MGIIDRTREAWHDFRDVISLRQENRSLGNQLDHVEEAMSRLQLEIENFEYIRMSGYMEYEFTRQRVQDLIRMSIWMALKNPITSRSVNVQADYVFGRGVTVTAEHPLVQSVIDEFWRYEKNRKSLTDHSSMLRREREQQVQGNLFIALFTNPRTGRVTVRFIDTQEIVDIVRDPLDYEVEWFIKRAWTDEDGHAHTEFYPAIGVTESTPGVKIPTSQLVGNSTAPEIRWDCCVYHVMQNRFGHMKFGIPENYAQHDWALAYKGFLENWTTIMRAFARMAMKVTGLSGKKQAAAAKSLMQTSVSITNPFEKNPSVAAASTPLLGKGVDVEPVKTAGSTTEASAGEPVLSMAATAAGLPSSFFGDPSAGNDNLDRPTELHMLSRQELWKEIFRVVIEYVILQSALAPRGLLAEAGAEIEMVLDPFTDASRPVVLMPVNEDTHFGVAGEPIPIDFVVDFPDILERNVTDRVRALVNGLTLFGKPLTDIIPDKVLVCRLIMQALNIPNPGSYMPRFIDMWEKNMKAEPGVPVESTIIPPAPIPGTTGAEDPSQGGDVGANG